LYESILNFYICLYLFVFSFVFHILTSSCPQFPCGSQLHTHLLSICHSGSHLLISSPQYLCSLFCLSHCQILAVTLNFDLLLKLWFSLVRFSSSGLLKNLVFCFPSLAVFLVCFIVKSSHTICLPLDN